MTEQKQALDAEVVPAQALAVREPHAGALDAALPASDKLPGTAAQAKIDAVAALTMSAYARAATLDLTPEEAESLKADFPDDAFQPGAAGKDHLIYIEHAHLRDRFNQVFGMGKWAIVPRNRWAEPFKTQKGDDGSRVYVEAMLVVRGCFVGEAVGAMEYYPKNAAQNYGDAVEGAKTAAFRRCAKEFGVGLQAWKKEFCDGWWTRKRGGRDFSRKPAAPAPGRAAQPPPPSTPTEPPKAPLQAKGKPPTPKVATDATRKWWIAEIEKADCREKATQFAIDLAWILPNEKLEEIQLMYVPVSKKETTDFFAKMATWSVSGKAEAPYQHEVGAPAPAPPPPAAPAPAAPKDNEWWRDVIVPIPHKGEKRVDYLKHPDTIGSLFDLRHGNDEEAQAARQRLWGFVNHYEAKGWVKHNGQQMPPSDGDVKFREALDAFSEWFSQNHPDEKL